MDELIKKIPATLSDANLMQTDNNDDIVITLGSDVVDAYKYNEANIDDYNKAQDTEDNTDFTKGF